MSHLLTGLDELLDGHHTVPVSVHFLYENKRRKTTKSKDT